MPDEIHQFSITVPLGTLKSAPKVFALAMPPRIVEQIDIRVPPGPRGEVGWALGASGLAVIPQEVGGWVVADGETVSWPLEKQIDSGAWQIIAYNTGNFDHRLYIAFRTRVVPAPGELAGGFLPLRSDVLNPPSLPLLRLPGPATRPLPASGV